MAATSDLEHAAGSGVTRRNSAWMSIISWVSQPDYGEQALEITNALITSGSIDVFWWSIGGRRWFPKRARRRKWAIASWVYTPG